MSPESNNPEPVDGRPVRKPNTNTDTPKTSETSTDTPTHSRNRNTPRVRCVLCEAENGFPCC